MYTAPQKIARNVKMNILGSKSLLAKFVIITAGNVIFKVTLERTEKSDSLKTGESEEQLLKEGKEIEIELDNEQLKKIIEKIIAKIIKIHKKDRAAVCIQ